MNAFSNVNLDTGVAICQNMTHKYGIGMPVQCGHVIKLKDVRDNGWKCPMCKHEDKEKWAASCMATVLNDI